MSSTEPNAVRAPAGRSAGSARILCADWAKERDNRAVYEAVVGERRVRRVRADVLDVRRLIEHASRQGGATLVAFDAPIGVPETFLRAVRRAGAANPIDGFIEWMSSARLDACAAADGWSPATPFFAVPGGLGSLRRFEDTARRCGVELRREIERRTGGKSAFITSGVPGSVGCAVLDLWGGLVATRAAGVAFRVWPFEDGAVPLEDAGCPVIAEAYPRAAYATALVDDAPRPRMAIAKRDRPTRRRAIRTLLGARWRIQHAVRIDDLDRAEANEDDFDAMMMAAALLRCAVENLPLWDRPIYEPRVEGAILGTGSIDLSQPETRFA